MVNNAQLVVAVAGNRSMPKALCMSGIIIALLLLVFFGLDLGLGTPFKGISPVMDIAMIGAAVVLAFLSWTSMREL
jgi:hypothetical protein